jgi:2-C-methyl-D-erythritol 2,4-cyclodiphosphate synthase
MTFRIGFGYDVHRLVEGRPLILGGVEIPYHEGLKGHSDADVLTHALIDAILGCLAMGDIGQHFPDSSPEYRDISSLLLLGKVMEWVQERGYGINNVDVTIAAQRPPLAPQIPAMRRNLAKVLQAEADQVNVKATSTEGLGFCGRGEGIAAYALASVTRKA